MDRPFMPKYGTVSQVLLQLVVAQKKEILVSALHWYLRRQGSNPGKPKFFQALFLQLHKLCL